MSKSHVNVTDNATGQTPLMLATLKGNSEVAKLLLDNKADPNLQLKDSFTALHLAGIGNSSKFR